MDEITDDLLELARKGRAVDDPTPTFLSELAADVRATVDGVSVEVESDGRLSVDPGRMRDLLSNLVANARDHGDASTVRVGTLRSGATGRATAGASDPAGGDGDGAGDATDGASGRARGFYVEDDGCGVPPDRRERVFESGYSTAETGTGFGLAIVERVAEAHGWTVDLTDGPDGGARFEFRPRAV
jgi:signal transduction histidine kinase